MRTCNCESEPEPMESDSPDDFRRDSLDFDHWTSLISEIETAYSDDVEKISSVYDSFLSEFPLCHGYWRRYADLKGRLCSVDKVVQVFERAVQSATYSVPLWVDYCNFAMAAFEDPSDIRRLFQRGMSFVGKDYSCHTLWDKYIEFEYSQQQWSSLPQIYIQALRFPTKKLHRYYESLKKFAASCEEEMKCQSSSTVDSQSETVLDSEAPTIYRDDEIALVAKDLLDPPISLERSKALQKYIYVGKQLYQEACRLDETIRTFEINIRRSYFHVKPIDVGQLENWHHYLDFVEIQGDFDWAVKFYERCLIPCANYPEFWMRYVEFMEINGGREIANYALDRATQIFMKRLSVIHLFNARFKEKIGDVSGARAAFPKCDTESDSQFVKNVMLKANMEKRMGNFAVASNIYKEALEMAAEKKKLHTLPILYVHFSRLTYMMTDSADAARDVLIDGIKHLPHCKSLLEELINFSIMHGGKRHLNVVDSIVATAISPQSSVSDVLNAKDAEDISSLYLEFVDLCGTIHEVRKVWNRHVRLFPSSTRRTFDQHATFTKLLKLARGTKETLVAQPQQPSGDCSSDSLIELPLHDSKMLLPDNHKIESGQDPTDQICDQKLSSPGSQLEKTTSDKLQPRQPENIQETLKLPSLEVSKEQSRDDTPEANLSSVDLVIVKQVSPEVSEEPRENTPEPKALSVELGCQVAEGNDSVEPSQEGTNRSDANRECDNKSEQDLKPLSLECLSLNSQENINLDLIPPIYLNCEGSQETCTSNGRKLESNCKSNEDSYMYSPRKARALETAGNKVVNPISTHALSQPAVNSYGDWHQNNRSGKVRRDSKFGFRGRLQRKSYQQQPVSPQKYPQTEVGGPMPGTGSLCQPSQFVSSQSPQIQQGSQDHNPYQAAATPANVMAPKAWHMQNVPQPNYASSCQPQLPVQSVVPQASQGSILGQYGMQNSQAYNQMWQYYYYQQQQQQFLLQQQLHQTQQQQQQPQPQPQQQQVLLQQYQQQPQQLQQYYGQMQQQQLQTQHNMQQQIPLQQQQYNQQLQMQQQQLQQPHQQQQLQEQQHLSYMQNNQQPLQQQSLMQEQQQQQISPGIKHDNYYHQDQAPVPPNNSDSHGTVVSSASPHTQTEMKADAPAGNTSML
ncbi:hypothetical protein PRUPE_4G074100 [Prunus persica]|uniref:Suppressor of forked domain-containing protein n=2 Tax=Prunus persica TaxID=3760 RepID=A0A251PH23_PRUPE|nr:uncharacterized protein LOC18778223 [Prunus persica]ONI10882.1 hypothetical protein PRUPE_4G074100 [Prunus persica]